MIKIIFDKNKSIAYDGNEKIGECNFEETEEGWNIVHTEVDTSYQGQGIARKLVEIILEKAEEHGKKVVADCSYAKKVIERKE